ncbi:MAG: vanadium-dependent haloperoxidase [Acidobacteriota bacterium]
MNCLASRIATNRQLRFAGFLLAASLLVPAPAGNTASALTGSSPVVRDWNLITAQVAAPPPTVTRSWALVHVAMFDAVNSIEQRYEPYAVKEAAHAGASAEAAAVQAAYRVLARRYPAAIATLDARRATSLSTIPGGPGKDAGIALGDSVGNQIYDLRVNDRINDPGPVYVPGTGPAAYQFTPPAFGQPVNTGVANWTPFALHGVSQFRPEGPYSITGRQFARDYNETRTWGAACQDPGNCARTPEQSQTALWHTERGDIQFNRIARGLVGSQGLDLLGEARLFALLNMALVDAGAAVFDAKYTYNFVRPVTAIRNGDADGNSRTAGDPTWSPFLVTPPHPEYPAAHSTVQKAAAVVMKKLIGRNVGFDDTTPAVPGVVRHFDSFDAFTDDGFVARIYGGMHYRSSLEVGRELGKHVGQFIVERMLRPDCGHHKDRDGEECDDD